MQSLEGRSYRGFCPIIFLILIKFLCRLNNFFASFEVEKGEKCFCAKRQRVDSLRTDRLRRSFPIHVKSFLSLASANLFENHSVQTRISKQPGRGRNNFGISRLQCLYHPRWINCRSKASMQEFVSYSVKNSKLS